jgi:transcriptional regulator with XRE-family HTH domain
VEAAALLRYARDKARLSQRELGKRAGISQATISLIEDGKTSPRFETLDRLLNVCGFELEIVPREGIGIDRSRMRELLRLPASERARIAIEEGRNLEEILPRRQS